MTVEELGKECEKRKNCIGCPFGEECSNFMDIAKDLVPDMITGFLSREV
ncbi:MAG: hypothetical protein NC548_31340 [Lachnospiraceae bacterium]|nr:hypothetical protein [Bacteroides fragilis]MCM1218999.1 hypothetical protein [Lachnospiraceae bacterium]